jgi:hypothetical protein
MISNPLNIAKRFLAWSLCFVCVAALHLRLFQYAEDDAYIHFRIVENFLRHGKPYFNLNEAVMVSSSPGWTLFLAVFFNVRSISPIEIAVINALFTTLGALIFVFLLRVLTGSSRKAGYYWLFGVIYVSLVLVASLGLMEIPLSLLILGLAILLFAKGNRCSFALLGIAVFFRLEFIVFLIVFYVYNLLQKKISARIALLYTAMGVLPFLFYDQFFFHTIIPHTLTAKSIIYFRSYFETFIGIIFGLIPGFPLASMSPAQIMLIIIFLILIALSIIILIVNSMRNGLDNEANQISLVVMLSGTFIALAYLKERVYLFPWYVPLYSIPIFFSLVHLIYSHKPRFQLALLTLLITPAIINLADITYSAFIDPSAFAGFERGARVRKYLEVGEYLHTKYPESTLMSSEIGGLGYGFKGHIVDAAGLASPEALRYHPMSVPDERSNGSIGAIPAGLVETTKPDIIVSYDIFIEDLIHSRVIENYYLIKDAVFVDSDLSISKTKTIWGSNHLNIFIRGDLVYGDVTRKGSFK